MAKTKAHHKPQHQPTMDDDKLDALKSLNAKLLKETVEGRQQIDLLVKSNSNLQSELNRSQMDNSRSQLEMNSLSETAVMLDIEKRLVSVFVIAQIRSLEDGMKRVLEDKSQIEKLMSEKQSEIKDLNSRLDQLLVKIDEDRLVSNERDELRVQLDARIQEVNELRLKVTEAEKTMAEILIQVRDLKANSDRLIEENAANQERIEFMMNEKDLIQKQLFESKGIVDELKKNMEELHQQMKAIQDEKNTAEIKNNELQTSANELKKLVESLKIQKEDLLEKFELISKHEVEMQMKINELEEEKKETEERVLCLGKEKTLISKDLEDIMNELQQQKLKFEQIIQEKIEAENAKIQLESEIAKVKEELSVFKDMISSLEMASMIQIEKVNQLQDEVGSYKASFDQATMERDEALKNFDKEKAVASELKRKTIEMEKEVKDLQKELTTENEKHLGEKEELERRCTGLVKKIASLEAELSETRTEFDDTKGKLDVTEANSKRVLKILKKIHLVCDENNDVDEENGVEEGIKDHVTEVEAIKRAFRDKESRVEEMVKQLELVKSSADEARRGKSFWTMMSSATTLLAAAVSVAYVARAH